MYLREIKVCDVCKQKKKKGIKKDQREKREWRTKNFEKIKLKSTVSCK